MGDDVVGAVSAGRVADGGVSGWLGLLLSSGGIDSAAE
jgi:hypothetical protein